MPCRERCFERGEAFHLVSRALEGARIFEEEKDRCRFIFQLQAANRGRPAPNAGRHDVKRAVARLLEGGELSSLFLQDRHKPFVHLLDFALVGNHYHLHLVSRKKDAIPHFIRRLNLGFAKYFNLRHERRGTLFAGRYKARAIKNRSHSDAVRRYLSVISPLDVYRPGWRSEGLEDPKRAFDFLLNYRFSSFLDNLGERESGILAPLETRKKYGLPPVADFLDFVKCFLKEEAAHSYSLSCLE